ncbi:hypothetical protein WR25_22920 [Diploscapter pachys]|uniref:MULE transposase domain-containing protein n=1 Tax=Diploscapter pachys TaxID=2018661 RepID=A0A2A2L2H2_9BILA|nr:hypothetical protein WR25_22920 [Diploscapter pachys]
MTYEFAWQRRYNDVDTYICAGCRAIPKGAENRTGHYVSVKMIDSEFQKDPRTLPHVCQPRKSAIQIADRLGYEFTREIRTKPTHFADKNPKQAYQAKINEIQGKDFGGISSKQVERAFTRGEHHRHRSALSRALNSNGHSRVTFMNVPDEFKMINNDQFLQLKTNDLHLFFRTETLKMAVDAGLHTLIGDGVHSFHPAELGRKAQLYGLHGVCKDAQAKPLVFAVTANKLTRTYTAIFQRVAEELKKHGADIDRINVIMDFEQASHNAAESIIYEFMWLKQFRALPLLPPSLLPKVEALRTLPVKPSHSAHSACKNFLHYFQKIWMDSRMLAKWNKWLAFEHRTTNMAEAWHNAMKSTIRCQHPPYSTLLEKLKNEETATNNFLANRLYNQQPTRPLRKRDQDRRDAVKDAMETFEKKIARRAPTRKEVSEYLEEIQTHRKRNRGADPTSTTKMPPKCSRYELECWRNGNVDIIADVQHSGMTEEMERTACRMGASALRMFNTQMDVAEYLKKMFDIEFGPCWHCICGKQFGTFISTEPGK